MTTLRLLSAACCTCLVTLAPVQAAAPTLTYLFPAGAQQGQAVEVTAAGTFDPWPVQGWADGKGIEVQAARAKGKLTVKVAPDAAPGVHWLRLYNQQGASSLRPFVIGTLAEVLEKEPNDDFRKPQLLDASMVVVNGRLDRTGDVDAFALKLHRGQTLVASLDANRLLGSPMDAVLQVVSADGFVLDQNNDYHDLDPQAAFVVPANGTYLVRIFAFPATPTSSIRFASGNEFIYRLTLTTGGFMDHPYPLAIARSDSGTVAPVGWNIPDSAKSLALNCAPGQDLATVSHAQLGNTALVRLEPHATLVEAEPNDRQHPQSIQLSATISGRIDVRGDVDVYRFQAKKDQKLLVQTESRALGYPLDSVLRLTDAAGKILSEVDDLGRRRDATRDAELSFTVPRDGTYHIEVRDLHGDGGQHYVYRLRALLAEPDYALTLATDRFTLSPGKPLDIPVTVERRSGFDREIDIRAEDLPEGVTAAVVKSTGSAKTATLRVTAEKGPQSAAFRIIGQAAGLPTGIRSAQTAITGFTASTAQPWLTILKPGETAPTPPAKSRSKKK